MNFAYDLAGGAPIVKKLRIATGVSAITTAGGYVTNNVADGTGVVFGLTTTVADQVGAFIDTANGLAGTTTPTNDTNALLSVIISPLAVYRMRMGSGATATQLELITGTDTSKTANIGTTGDIDPSSPQMDEGTAACVGGTNLGQVRKITSTATALTFTHIEGWVNTPVAGDQYVIVPWTPNDVAGDNINLTTDLTNARRDIAVGTGADLRIIALEFDFASVTLARNNSWVYAKFDDHIYLLAT